MRILGIDIPDNKKVEFALPYIYGVGLAVSRMIIKSTNIDPNKSAKDLTNEEVRKIQSIIEKNFKVGGDLRREISDNVKHLKETNAWRGLRHLRGLPIHGRTKTNSRTIRGNVRKTMGSGRKPTAQKT